MSDQNDDMFAMGGEVNMESGKIGEEILLEVLLDNKVGQEVDVVSCDDGGDPAGILGVRTPPGKNNSRNVSPAKGASSKRKRKNRRRREKKAAALNISLGSGTETEFSQNSEDVSKTEGADDSGGTDIEMELESSTCQETSIENATSEYGTPVGGNVTASLQTTVVEVEEKASEVTLADEISEVTLADKISEVTLPDKISEVSLPTEDNLAVPPPVNEVDTLQQITKDKISELFSANDEVASSTESCVAPPCSPSSARITEEVHESSLKPAERTKSYTKTVHFDEAPPKVLPAPTDFNSSQDETIFEYQLNQDEVIGELNKLAQSKSKETVILVGNVAASDSAASMSSIGSLLRGNGSSCEDVAEPESSFHYPSRETVEEDHDLTVSTENMESLEDTIQIFKSQFPEETKYLGEEVDSILSRSFDRISSFVGFGKKSTPQKDGEPVLTSFKALNEDDDFPSPKEPEPSDKTVPEPILNENQTQPTETTVPEPIMNQNKTEPSDETVPEPILNQDQIEPSDKTIPEPEPILKQDQTEADKTASEPVWTQDQTEASEKILSEQDQTESSATIVAEPIFNQEQTESSATIVAEPIFNQEQTESSATIVAEPIFNQDQTESSATIVAEPIFNQDEIESSVTIVPEPMPTLNQDQTEQDLKTVEVVGEVTATYISVNEVSGINTTFIVDSDQVDDTDDIFSAVPPVRCEVGLVEEVFSAIPPVRSEVGLVEEVEDVTYGNDSNANADLSIVYEVPDEDKSLVELESEPFGSAPSTPPHETLSDTSTVMEAISVQYLPSNNAAQEKSDSEWKDGQDEKLTKAFIMETESEMDSEENYPGKDSGSVQLLTLHFPSAVIAGSTSNHETNPEGGDQPYIRTQHGNNNNALPEIDVSGGYIHPSYDTDSDGGGWLPERAESLTKVITAKEKRESAAENNGNLEAGTSSGIKHEKKSLKRTKSATSSLPPEDNFDDHEGKECNCAKMCVVM